MSADRPALAVVTGMVLGNIPIFGTSTILCVVIALTFRLNQPAIQIAQAAMAPIYRRAAAERFENNQAEQHASAHARDRPGRGQLALNARRVRDAPFAYYPSFGSF